MENLDSEPIVTDGDSGDGSAGDDCAHRISVTADSHYEYVTVKEEPELKFAATAGNSGDGGVGDDYASNIGVDSYYDPPKEEPELKFAATNGDNGDASANSYYDCDLPKEDPVPEFIDVHYHPLKKEPKPELDGGDSDAVGIDSYYVGDLLKEEPKPELGSTGEGTVADSSQDVAYECSPCGATLCTQEFKVKHEHRCKVQVQRREFESHVREVYHCGYCSCPFLSKEYKEQHQQKYCRKRPVTARRDFKGTNFECDQCEYITKWKHEWKRHVFYHNKNNAEWFTCTLCSYKTVHKCDVAKHMEVHSDTFSYCCPICGKTFRRKRFVDNHLLKQHFDESDEVSKLITTEIYTCDICNRYRTASKTNFKQHVAITHYEGIGCEKYVCSHCPYSTYRKSSIRNHSKTHAEQKDYRCTVCKQQFTSKRGLDSHVLYIHADNGRFDEDDHFENAPL